MELDSPESSPGLLHSPGQTPHRTHVLQQRSLLTQLREAKDHPISIGESSGELINRLIKCLKLTQALVWIGKNSINFKMHPNTCIKLLMHLYKKLSIHSNMYTHIRHTHTFIYVRVHCTKFYSYGTYNKKFQPKGIVNGNFFEKFTFYLCDFG